VKYHVANALAKLGLASRAELRLWNGVAQASALDVTEPDMEVSIAAVGQISRTVADIAAARAWYQDVLGLPHQYSFGDLAFFDCGGVRLFLSQREAGNAAAAQSIICFRVDDIRGGQNLLAESGVVFINAPHLIHRHADGAEEWMAFFNDNEGRPLAVMALHRP
jgi:catechol 2,3-dioxygenase-like lactoylglutathione lyase family enzyme